jgi:flagellar biogenesis protein FliO
MSTTTAPSAGSKTRLWVPWLTMAVVALGAVAAGLLVPQFMSADMVIEADRTKAETKNKAPLAPLPPSGGEGGVKGKPAFVTPVLPDMPSPRGMLTRLAWGTVLVLALAVAAIWGMRRWTQTHDLRDPGGRALRLVETLPLGNRCSVHLVHFGKREVLVGVDSAGIKTIVPLPKEFAEVLAEESAVKDQESARELS